MPGDDKAIASVVSFAANNGHGTVAAELAERIDAAAAGIFHQYQARHSILIYRPAIGLANFGPSEGTHIVGLCIRYESR
jgi:hypothetical protein